MYYVCRCVGLCIYACMYVRLPLHSSKILHSSSVVEELIDVFRTVQNFPTGFPAESELQYAAWNSAKNDLVCLFVCLHSVNKLVVNEV